MYIEKLCDTFIEFSGDRNSKDDKAVTCGIGTINGEKVTIIATNKGKNLEENIRFNFGMPSPEGYRKVLRLVKQAEKFKRHVLFLVDVPGAYAGVVAEEKGQGEAIGRNILEMIGLKTRTLSIITGEGGSGGALAIATSDRVWMLENAVYSILSPEGFASILWKDAKRAEEAAEVMKITAEDLKNLKIIDKIIEEPENLNEEVKMQEEFIEDLKTQILEEFKILKEKNIDELLSQRYLKFRNMGNK